MSQYYVTLSQDYRVCDYRVFWTPVSQRFLGGQNESQKKRMLSHANTREKECKIYDVWYLFQLQTNAITTMVDVASFVCWRLLEESVHAQMVSIFGMMDKLVTVILRK